MASKCRTRIQNPVLEDLWMENFFFQPRPLLAFQLTCYHFHEPLGGPAGVTGGPWGNVEPKEGRGGLGNCRGWGYVKRPGLGMAG